MSRPERVTRPAATPARLGLAALGLAVFAAVMWAAWLGWDDDYYTVDGVEQGPYRTWQVLGCGASVAVGAVLAQAWARTRGAVVLAVAAAVGFAVPWTVHAAATDDSGLWFVGLVLLLGGAVIGLVLLLTVAAAVRSRLAVRSRGVSR